MALNVGSFPINYFRLSGTFIHISTLQSNINTHVQMGWMNNSKVPSVPECSLSPEKMMMNYFYYSPTGIFMPYLLLVSHAFLIIIIAFLFFPASCEEAAALFASHHETAADAGLMKNPLNHSKLLSCFFIFGDSTVDPGNNNYIATLSKSNFPPYGKDFVNHSPTGRFTNGKLVTDFIAGYLGIKEIVPPYLDPTLSFEELKSGVSFASAGSGYDPLTAELSSVIPLQQQLDYFREYKARMQQAMGKEKAKALIKNAAFLISCGTNDYVVNYFTAPLRRYTYTVSQYQQLLLELLHNFIQDLVAEGAEKIVVVGLPPMGCLPIVITLNSRDALNNRRCIEKISSAARNYNVELQKLLRTLRRPNLELVYADIYSPLDDMIRYPSKYGYTHINSGCCGTGLIEGGVLCNPHSLTCSDDSKYVFWDSVHPTQATYYNLFKALRPTVDAFLKYF